MCLARINERLTPGPDVTRAWKVVTREVVTRSVDVLRGLFVGQPLPTGQWLEAQIVHLAAQLGNDYCYDSGFHCFTRRTDAEAVARTFGPDCQAIPVLVRYVHTRGVEYYSLRPREWTKMEVLVAKEIFVPDSPDSQTDSLGEPTNDERT